MSEETVRLNDRIIMLERDNEILVDKLHRANFTYECLRKSEFTIREVIKRGEDFDEMLMITKTYPTEGGVVVEVS